MKGKKHKSEQLIRKLREAEASWAPEDKPVDASLTILTDKN